jgi:hypothetical protein
MHAGSCISIEKLQAQRRYIRKSVIPIDTPTNYPATRNCEGFSEDVASLLMHTQPQLPLEAPGELWTRTEHPPKIQYSL